MNEIATINKYADFKSERSRLHRIAYRMLGSLSDADDIVQDAWLRWERVSLRVDNPSAYMTRIVTRLCLDRIKSAQSRRESYIGPWLPEPLLSASDDDSYIADDITLSLMLAMERLSPLERAAFLLYDVFDIPLSEIATIIKREPAAVRQLASRARKHIQNARPRFQVEETEAESISTAFFRAAYDGDTLALSTMLAEHIEIHADGGGKVLAFRNIIHGVEKTLRLFLGQSRKKQDRPTLLRTCIIDGLPGYISIDRGGVIQTTALEVCDGKIIKIFIVRNPDKLKHLNEETGSKLGIEP